MTLIGLIFDMVGALLLSVDITSLSRIDILRSGSMQIGSSYPLENIGLESVQRKLAEVNRARTGLWAHRGRTVCSNYTEIPMMDANGIVIEALFDDVPTC